MEFIKKYFFKPKEKKVTLTKKEIFVLLHI